jgi:hypothetical protein
MDQHLGLILVVGGLALLSEIIKRAVGALAGD